MPAPRSNAWSATGASSRKAARWHPTRGESGFSRPLQAENHPDNSNKSRISPWSQRESNRERFEKTEEWRQAQSARLQPARSWLQLPSLNWHPQRESNPCCLKEERCKNRGSGRIAASAKMRVSCVQWPRRKLRGYSPGGSTRGPMESRERASRLARRETCRSMVEMLDTRYVTGYKRTWFGAFAIGA